MTSTFFRICPRRNSHEQTEQHVGDNQHKPHVQSRDCQNVCHTGPRSTSSLRRGSNALFSPATNAETISLSASSMFTLCDTLYRCLMQHRNSPESTAVRSLQTSHDSVFYDIRPCTDSPTPHQLSVSTARRIERIQISGHAKAGRQRQPSSRYPPATRSAHRSGSMYPQPHRSDGTIRHPPLSAAIFPV